MRYDKIRDNCCGDGAYLAAEHAAKRVIEEYEEKQTIKENIRKFETGNIVSVFLIVAGSFFLMTAAFYAMSPSFLVDSTESIIKPEYRQGLMCSVFAVVGLLVLSTGLVVGFRNSLEELMFKNQ